MTEYIAIAFPPDQNNRAGWRIEVPDVPDFSGTLPNLDNVLQAGGALLSRHIADKLVANGLVMPAASPYAGIVASVIYANALKQGAVTVLLKATPVAPARERINIMIAPLILAQIDRRAEEMGISRSAFIERTAGKAAQRRII